MSYPNLNAWFERGSAAQRIFICASVTCWWVMVAVDLIQRIDGGRLAAAVTSFGMLCCLSAAMLTPACWAIVETAPGSNSRKALAALLLFGFLLQISGLVARMQG